MKKTAILTALAAITILASCADVPDNVKDRKQGQEDKVEIKDSVTVDKLLEGAEDIPAYIKAHGYEG